MNSGFLDKNRTQVVKKVVFLFILALVALAYLATSSIAFACFPGEDSPGGGSTVGKSHGGSFGGGSFGGGSSTGGSFGGGSFPGKSSAGGSFGGGSFAGGKFQFSGGTGKVVGGGANCRLENFRKFGEKRQGVGREDTSACTGGSVPSTGKRNVSGTGKKSPCGNIPGTGKKSSCRKKHSSSSYIAAGLKQITQGLKDGKERFVFQGHAIKLTDCKQGQLINVTFPNDSSLKDVSHLMSVKCLGNNKAIVKVDSHNSLKSNMPSTQFQLEVNPDGVGTLTPVRTITPNKTVSGTRGVK